MLESLITLITDWIVQTIRTSGYTGIFVFMALESALIPIPSEIIMPFSGSLAFSGQFSFWLVVLVGAVGNLAGSLLAYSLGWWGQDRLVRKLINKYGKFLLLSESDYELSSRWFFKYGSIVVLVSRVLPVVRTFISLPAGIAKLPLTKFIPLTFFGSLAWSAFLAFVGFKLHENWSLLGPYFRKFDIVIVAGVIIIVAIYLYKKLKLKK